MSLRLSRRLLLAQLFLLTACRARSTGNQFGRLVIGIVSYDEGSALIDQYATFNNYLGEQTGALIELEPTFNENKALERIRSQAWSLVFAPPGLAALAISQNQYVPMFPLQGIKNLRSVLVVPRESPLQDLKELAGKIVVLGQPGSATGYYWPLYNLYGLTLAEVMFAPTPKAALEAVARGEAVAGALSAEELDTYGSQVAQTRFRVLYSDPHQVPPGAVLVGPTIERNLQEQLRKVMSEVPSTLAQEAGYIPTAPPPDYDYMISVVKRVTSVSDRLRQKPARLF